MNMDRSLSDFLRHPAPKAWNGIFIVAGICVLSAAALVFLILYRSNSSPDVTRAEAKATGPVAELVSATGMVITGKPGRAEWNQIAVGARLMEGDLIQTDKSGGAGIRYSNGNTVTIQENTVLTVRSVGDGSMEISVPSAENSPPSSGSGQEHTSSPPTAAEDRAAVAAFNKAKAGEPGPFIRLDRIVPFGRSLELVGNVEAGSRLSVNNESVDVTGDGSFKHFTNTFPVSVGKANLVMKVTDLAGRMRVVAAIHDFNSRDGDK
jgi:hypothetical protein